MSTKLKDLRQKAVKAAYPNTKKEKKPSEGLSKNKKSAIAKKAQKGGDIGKKGKNFDKVAEKAGGGEKGKRIAAAAMWKNAKR